MTWQETFARRLEDGTAWSEGFTAREVEEMEEWHNWMAEQDRPLDIGDRFDDGFMVTCLYPKERMVDISNKVRTCKVSYDNAIMYRIGR